jgi:hypothetical protein
MYTEREQNKSLCEWWRYIRDIIGAGWRKKTSPPIYNYNALKINKLTYSNCVHRYLQIEIESATYILLTN